jgi:hypothetical protein
MCECALRAALTCALTVGSLVWMSGVARAQQVNDAASSSYTDFSDYLVIGNQPLPRQVAVPGPANLSSTVTQIGQGNIASATLSGSANVTNQFQIGTQNSSTLTVNGVQNAITTSQIGNGNTTSISVQGNGNAISNLQVGSGLSYQIQVLGSGAPISVQQYGRK